MDNAKKALNDKIKSHWKAEQRRVHIGRAVRWGIGIPLALFAYPALGLFSPFLALLGIILIVPDIVSYLYGFADNMLCPHKKGEPQPLYGIPESLVAKGKYAEAEREYEKIIEEFPLEVKPHIDMITLAVTRLNNAELANKLYQRGMDLLSDSASQQILKTMYEAISTRLKDK